MKSLKELLISMIEIADKPGEAPIRLVSPTEYKVLESLVRDGYRVTDGFPETRALDEYLKRMQQAHGKWK